MEQLFETLGIIKGLLEQVLQITENQMTILLDRQEVSAGLDVIEEMATYKSDLTSEVEQVESVFEAQYNAYKGEVAEQGKGKLLKESVDAILKLKESIIQSEQKNVFLMQELLRGCAKQMTLQKNPAEVVNAYKVNTAYQKGK